MGLDYYVVSIYHTPAAAGDKPSKQTKNEEKPPPCVCVFKRAQNLLLSPHQNQLTFSNYKYSDKIFPIKLPWNHSQ